MYHTHDHTPRRSFQNGSTHAAKTALPAPREMMVRPLYHGHSYQQLTVRLVVSCFPIQALYTRIIHRVLFQYVLLRTSVLGLCPAFRSQRLEEHV
jgi:hypothetical protein